VTDTEKYLHLKSAVKEAVRRHHYHGIAIAPELFALLSKVLMDLEKEND
jgi:hypothetical protein